MGFVTAVGFYRHSSFAVSGESRMLRGSLLVSAFAVSVAAADVVALALSKRHAWQVQEECF